MRSTISANSRISIGGLWVISSSSRVIGSNSDVYQSKARVTAKLSRRTASNSRVVGKILYILQSNSRIKSKIILVRPSSTIVIGKTTNTILSRSAVYDANVLLDGNIGVRSHGHLSLGNRERLGRSTIGIISAKARVYATVLKTTPCKATISLALSKSSNSRIVGKISATLKSEFLISGSHKLTIRSSAAIIDKPFSVLFGTFPSVLLNGFIER